MQAGDVSRPNDYTGDGDEDNGVDEGDDGDLHEDD